MLDPGGHRVKTLRNQVSSVAILRKNNIKFEVKNNGIHVLVWGTKEMYDFWPGTGLFIGRKTRKRRRGVFKLVKLCIHTQE